MRENICHILRRRPGGPRRRLTGDPARVHDTACNPFGSDSRGDDGSVPGRYHGPVARALGGRVLRPEHLLAHVYDELRLIARHRLAGEGAARRSGVAVPVAATLDDADGATEKPLEDLIALGQALERLERMNPRQARVVECRFFGGLSLDETAEALGIR